MKSFTLTNLFLFLLLSLVAYFVWRQFPMMSFGVLMATNALMFALSWLSSLIVGKQMHERPQAFVRGVYSATFLKLIICMGSFLGFVLLHRAHIYKPLVFAMFGIYIFYTVAETIILSKMARAKQ